MPSMNSALVHHIAQLSSIPLTQKEEEKLAEGFSKTLLTVDKLMEVDTAKVEATHQVTGLENVWREDEVDGERSFTQEEALANTKQTHNGYFVVPRLIGE